MLEQEKWKDRVEVSLDNRQIFLLFSASAVLLSLVFALGIVVGRRLSPPVIARPTTDPLALLDQMDAPKEETPRAALTFSKALSTPAKPSAAAAPAAHPAPKPAPKPAPSKETKLAAKSVKVPAPAAEKSATKATPKPTVAPSPAKPAVTRGQPKAVAHASKVKQPKAKKAAAKEIATDDDNDGAGFTLQLSSFQDKHEAEQYVQSLRAKGHDPQVLPTKIPGRGMWFRVRVGHFTSWKAAVAAKEKFEHEHQLIAYVARR